MSKITKSKSVAAEEGTADFSRDLLGDRKSPFDCAIIGGGPGGLSSSIYMGRLRRSTMIVDDHAGRSLWSQVNRNYLGFPDGVEAAELRQLGRLQAAKYGAAFCDGTVRRIEKDGDLFCVQVKEADAPDAGTEENIERDEEETAELGEVQISGESEFYARTLILCTGVRDHFPEFTGRDECVGKTLFWCMLCDGYEALGKRAVVLGDDEEAVATALQMRQFTNSITLVANNDHFNVSDARLEDLRSAAIEPIAARVCDFQNDTGCVTGLELIDEAHTVVPLDVLFSIHVKTPNTDLAKQLGVELDELGYILTDSEMKTNVPGVYAAGDVTRLHNHQVTSAVHEGGMAAAAANYYLYGDLQKEQHGKKTGEDEPTA